eukprot:6289304-Heterocapsa_arctica.AAC.1
MRLGDQFEDILADRESYLNFYASHPWSTTTGGVYHRHLQPHDHLSSPSPATQGSLHRQNSGSASLG